MSIGKAVFAGALQYELRRLVEIGGGGDTMQASQVAEILVGSGPARFVS